MNKDLIFIIENMSPRMQKELLRQHGFNKKSTYFYTVIKENGHGVKELKKLMQNIIKNNLGYMKKSLPLSFKPKSLTFEVKKGSGLDKLPTKKKKKVVKKKKTVVKKKKKVVKKKKKVVKKKK
tara:strand:+ start:627 stop:995 length:369 start_codon:yes stop_codon:yes gene_type:complete